MQFAYQPATYCIDDITVLKETVIYYKSERSDVYGTMVHLAKAYDGINTSFICDETKETDFPGYFIALINTFVCTSYGWGNSSPKCGLTFVDH